MMPLSEFHSVKKGKHDSIQPKMMNCSSDLSSFVPDQEFVELLWENGHIVMQGQSNRPKKSSSPCAFPSYAGKAQDKEGGDAVPPKSNRYGATDSTGKDFQTMGTSGQTGLSGQETDIVPWPNYPIDDYCTEFLSEFSGVSLKPLSSTGPADRISSCIQVTRGAHVAENGNGTRDSAGCSETSVIMGSQLFQLPQQCQSFIPGSRAKESDFTRGTIVPQGSSGDVLTTDLQKHDLTSCKPKQLNSNMNLTNFSHFSRPVALVKANMQSLDRLRSEKTSTTMGGSPMESTLIEPVSDLKSFSGFHGQQTSFTDSADLKPSKPLQEMVSIEHSDAVCREDASENSRNYNQVNTMNSQRSPDHMKCHGSSLTDSVAVVKCEADKRPVRVAASPSMCSANGAAATSNAVKNRGKRKSQEGEESGYQSEDIEDDSFDVKKPVPGRGTSTKRSRAAEVHNMSERRRRDRINEKMRALQELIPNCTHCNKVDKASVLDEAIEYLKSLQMQLQIMSMANGLCMPPMMLPAGVRATHRGPFAPVGVGMGLGFGMGMLDMTASPLLPLPPMHGPLYTCPAIPGTAVHGMLGPSNLHMFGTPRQTSPMPMPHAAPFIPLTGMSWMVNPLAEVSRAEACPVQATESAPHASKDRQLQTQESGFKTSTDNAQANKGCIEQSSVADADNQTSEVCGNEATNCGNAVTSSATTSIG